MRRCNMISCNHEMCFLRNDPTLRYVLVCTHCGHETTDQSVALFRTRRAGLLMAVLAAVVIQTALMLIVAALYVSFAHA